MVLLSLRRQAAQADSFRLSAQRRPLVGDPFSLDAPDAALVHLEESADETARLIHGHLAILGVDHGEEDFFAPVFRKFFVCFFLDHEPLLRLNWLN
jgi:hypothetical protein